MLIIVFQKLDFIPWEVVDILQNHPVTRMPSLHFTYSLFKEHESTIINGVKTGISRKNGTYIINPGLDLKLMEKRLTSFFDYWTPDWTGLIGVTPSVEDFQKLLTDYDIFV